MQRDLRSRKFPLMERVERISKRDKAEIAKEIFLDSVEEKPRKFFTKLEVKKERKYR